MVHLHGAGTATYVPEGASKAKNGPGVAEMESVSRRQEEERLARAKHQSIVTASKWWVGKHNSALVAIETNSVDKLHQWIDSIDELIQKGDKKPSQQRRSDYLMAGLNASFLNGLNAVEYALDLSQDDASAVSDDILRVLYRNGARTSRPQYFLNKRYQEALKQVDRELAEDCRGREEAKAARGQDDEAQSEKFSVDITRTSLNTFANAIAAARRLETIAPAVDSMGSWYNELRFALLDARKRFHDSLAISVLGGILDAEQHASEYRSIVRAWGARAQSESQDGDAVGSADEVDLARLRGELVQEYRGVLDSKLELLVKMQTQRAAMESSLQRLEEAEKGFLEARRNATDSDDLSPGQEDAKADNDANSPSSSDHGGSTTTTGLSATTAGTLASTPLPSAATLPCSLFRFVREQAGEAGEKFSASATSIVEWIEQCDCSKPQAEISGLLADAARATHESVSDLAPKSLQRALVRVRTSYTRLQDAINAEEARLQELEPMAAFPSASTEEACAQARLLLGNWLKAAHPESLFAIFAAFQEFHDELVAVEEPSLDRISALHGDFEEAKDMLVHAEGHYSIQQRRLSRQSGTRSQGSASAEQHSKLQKQAHEAEQAFVEARAKVQAVHRALNAEQARQMALISNHFPEYLTRGEFSTALGFDDFHDHITCNLSLDMFDVAEWPRGTAPGKSANTVLLRRFQNHVCVLKAYPIDQADAGSSRRRLIREVNTLRKLSHANVAPIERVFIDNAQGKAFIQMPLFEGGTLSHWVSRPEHEAPRSLAMKEVIDRTSERACLFYLHPLLSVLHALEYLHEHGMVHGDLKLANILVAGDGTAVLSDFELSRDLSFEGGGDLGAAGAQQATTRAGAGTPFYRAPEVEQGSRASKHSDMYAFGMCCFFLLGPGLVAPTSRDQAAGLLQKIQVGDAEFASALQALVLAPTPEDRPSATGMTKHPLMSSMDLSKHIGEREEAARLEKQRARERLRTCVICGDDSVDVGEGITCQQQQQEQGEAGAYDGAQDQQQQHFACNVCFDGFVKTQTDAETRRLFAAHGGMIHCFGFQCPSTAFSHQLVAQHTSPETYDQYESARRAILEQGINASLERDFEERLQLKEREWAELSEADRRRRAIRAHIVERVLTLSCPRCGQAFIDFNGCCALTCSRDNAAFCAFCLADCEDDAHAHVRRCEFNPNNGDLFCGGEQFKQAQNRRRTRMLEAYLGTLSAEDKARALEDCRQDLTDLNMRVNGL